MSAINEELVKRIARLAKQNQELEEHIKQLEKLNKELTYDLEKFRVLYEKVSPVAIRETGETEKKERSLKFNMATVLFADIHGFSHLIEVMDSSTVMDELDEIIMEFESIVKKYKLKKSRLLAIHICVPEEFRKKILQILSMWSWLPLK